MSEEQLQAFIAKVKSDTSLQEKLKAAASPEASIEIAKEAGFSITLEDTPMYDSSTVSDEELEAAAGGGADFQSCRREQACHQRCWWRGDTSWGAPG